MIVKNKIEKPFGPAATTTGIVFFIVGIIYAYIPLVGIVLIVGGAFIGFTYESTFLDIEKRKIKFSNILFGIIPTGKWVDIKNEMTIGLDNSRRGFRTYSRGMRTNDTIVKDLRIVLYGSNRKKIGPIKKCENAKTASEDLELLHKELQLEVRKSK